MLFARKCQLISWLVTLIIFSSPVCILAKSSSSMTLLATPTVPTTPVDINGASVEQLIAVPGIDNDVAGQIVSRRPFSTTDALVSEQILTEERYRKIKDSLVANPSKGPIIGVWEAVFIWLCLVITGIVLGLKRTITVYRNTSDMWAAFGVAAVPLIMFFGALFQFQAWMEYLIGTVGVLTFLWIVQETYKDNPGILSALLALITKMSLAFMIVFKALDAWKPTGKTAMDRYRNQLSSVAWVAALSTLTYALVRDKPGTLVGEAKSESNKMP